MFFNKENLVIKAVRTLSINEKIKTCKCEAEIDFSEEQAQKIIKALSELNLNASISMEDFYDDSDGIPISYSLQITDEGDQLYVEAEVTQDHVDAFMMYSAIKEAISEQRSRFPGKTGFFKKQRFSAVTEDCFYEITFNIDEDKQVKGSITQKCPSVGVEEQENFKGWLKGKTIYAEETGGNKFEIDLTENGLDYYLTKRVFDDGSEDNFKRKNPRKYTKIKGE